MKTVQIICDECKTVKGSPGDTLKRDAWLTMCNPDIPSATKDQVRLNDEHHFCGFLCLSVWATKAKDAALQLVESASGLSPRGTFVNDKLGLHY